MLISSFFNATISRIEISIIFIKNIPVKRSDSQSKCLWIDLNEAFLINFVDPDGLFSLISLKPTKSSVRSVIKFGTAFGYGALVTALTGNPAAGAVTYGFVQLVFAKQLNQPHGIPIPVKYNLDLGIDWLNPASLNENEPTYIYMTSGDNCD